MKMLIAVGQNKKCLFLMKKPDTEKFAGVNNADLENIESECEFEDTPPGLYVAELAWDGTDEDGELVITDYKSECFFTIQAIIRDITCNHIEK